MSSGLSKSHRVTSRSPPFFPPSVLTGSFYQLILLTDCPQQFHYRQLACRREAGEQHAGARIPDESRTFTSARGDVCQALEGRRHKRSDGTSPLKWEQHWRKSRSELLQKLRARHLPYFIFINLCQNMLKNKEGNVFLLKLFDQTRRRQMATCWLTSRMEENKSK